MRCLIVEDEFTSRMQLKYFLDEYGTCDIAVNGHEALEAYKLAMAANKPYDLICLDIKLPDMNGQEILNSIRSMEESAGIQLNSGEAAKIFMTTASGDAKNIAEAFYGLCDEYLTKPIDKDRLVQKLKAQRLVF